MSVAPVVIPKVLPQNNQNAIAADGRDHSETAEKLPSYLIVINYHTNSLQQGAQDG